MAEKTCAHPSCSCSLPPDRMYCSEACRQSAERPTPTSNACECGHVQCAGDVGKRSERSLGQGAR